MVEFPAPLLNLLQLQSHLVPCTISARISIIPKLQNIYWRKLIIRESFFLRIEHLPNRYSVRPSDADCFPIPDLGLWEHLSCALPTDMIFHLLRSIPSERLTYDCFGESKVDILNIIIKWIRVSVFVNVTDKRLRLKTRFVSRDLVPSDRATCTIASGVNFYHQQKKKGPQIRLRSFEL